MRTFARGETIVLHRRIPRRTAGELTFDAYGILVTDEVIETIAGVVVWPSTNVETPQNQERTSATYTLALPDPIVVDAVDHVVWRGKSYELRGELEFNTNPNTGTRCHTVSMVRVAG